MPPNALAIVKPALEATYKDLDISPSDIGSFGSKQALGCATSSAFAVVPSGSLFSMTVVAVVAFILVLI